MLVSCFNKCVLIMCLLVKLDFAADLTLFPEYTIIIKINIIKNQSRVSYPFSEFVECRYGKGDHLPLAPSPYSGCVAILCRGFDATFMPWP